VPETAQTRFRRQQYSKSVAGLAIGWRQVLRTIERRLISSPIWRFAHMAIESQLAKLDGRGFEPFLTRDLNKLQTGSDYFTPRGRGV
jgi:hypothetical protein